MRYLPIVSGLGALVLAANTLACESPLPQVQKPHAAFEELIYGEYRQIARRNNQYIVDHVALTKDMQAIFSEPERASQNLVARLVLANHSYIYKRDVFLISDPNRWDNSNIVAVKAYAEAPREALNLTPWQIVRVYLLMDALKTQEFRAQIGNLIKDDLRDPYSEHGGLVLFDMDANLTLSDVPTASSERDDSSYGPPKESFNVPQIAHYHLQAVSQDNTGYSGPSGLDILGARDRAFYYGESHNIVITKLKGRRFNVDFYGCDVIGHNMKSMPQCTLNDIDSYGIMLDLGDYGY